MNPLVTDLDIREKPPIVMLAVEYGGEILTPCSDYPHQSSDGKVSVFKQGRGIVLSLESTTNYGGPPQDLGGTLVLRSTPTAVWLIRPIGFDYMVKQDSAYVFNEVSLPGTTVRGLGYSDYSFGSDIYVMIDDNGIEFWTHLALITRSFYLEPIVTIDQIDDFIHSLLGAPPS